MGGNINLTLNKDPVSNLYETGAIKPANGIQFIGTIGHGNILTITDSNNNFGLRQNVKPLYVNLGDVAHSNALGRLNDTFINDGAGCDIGQTAVKNGALPSAHRFNLTIMGDTGLTKKGLDVPDPTKEIYQYMERRYEWDFTNPRIQCNGFYLQDWPWTNTNTRSLTIDGRVYSHTNDGSAGSVSNGSAVSALLVADINNDALCKVTAVANDGTFNIRLTKKVPSDVFDVTSSNIYANFNNKTNRIWPGSGNTHDFYVATKSASVGSTVGENVTGTFPSYNPGQTPFEFLSQEYVFKQSSGPDVSDGYYRMYQNGVCLNPTTAGISYGAGKPMLNRFYLNQLSNGPYGYWQNELFMYLGYQCWDDEAKGIYFGDAPTVSGCTKLIRQPQTKWRVNVVKIHQIHTFVNPIGAYVYRRDSRDVFVLLGQIGV